MFWASKVAIGKETMAASSTNSYDSEASEEGDAEQDEVGAESPSHEHVVEA